MIDPPTELKLIRMMCFNASGGVYVPLPMADDFAGRSTKSLVAGLLVNRERLILRNQILERDNAFMKARIKELTRE